MMRKTFFRLLLPLAVLTAAAGCQTPPATTATGWAAFANSDSEDCRRLGPDVEKGSWWTDGNTYYQVTATGPTIRMEGGTLHEGGGVCAFKVMGDTALTTLMPAEGYTTFAEADRRITHHLLTTPTGDSVEVLVAYDADGQTPVAVLQRFDGDEMRFETDCLHQLLAGTYEPAPGSSSADKAWRYVRFLADGTVQRSPDDAPKPYAIETVWHSPSRVVCLPGGQRVAVARDSLLHIQQAHYDAEEEMWMDDTLHVALLQPRDKTPLLGNWLFAICALTIMAPDAVPMMIRQLDEKQAIGSARALDCLNALLLRQWMEEGGDADAVKVEMDSLAVSVVLKFSSLPYDALQQHCLAQLVGQSLFASDGEEPAAEQPMYRGDLQAYLQACVRTKWKQLWQDTFSPQGEEGQEPSADVMTPEEMAADAVSNGTVLTTFEMAYDKVYDTERLVRWACHYDLSVFNAAHPSFGGYGLTFSKADGRMLGHEMLKNTAGAPFRRLMKEALCRWIADEMGEEVADDASLKKFLFAEQADPNALPMPEQRPYLTEQGVVLPYMESELTFSREPARLLIPYNQAGPFLTVGR